MERVTTHVIDTHRGGPAAGVAVRLSRLTPSGAELVFAGSTGPDGRLLLHDGPSPLPSGRYQLVFACGDWFAASGVTCRFPRIAIHFEASRSGRYHLPLYLGPHSFTTYRGR